MLLWLLSGLLLSHPFQETDAFYLQTLEKAQKAFLAKDYPEALRNFEIAVFGFTGDSKLRARALIYLGLTQFYLKNIKASEESLREAAGLLSTKELDGLEIAEESRPDLDKLLTYFDIRPAQVETSPKENEKPAKTKPPPQPVPEQSPSKNPISKSDRAPVINVNKIKEGDVVPLELVDSQPVVIKSIEAVYPNWARQHGIVGTVVINALISEKGKVIKTQPLLGLKGLPGFNQAAESAVRHWRFEPASIKGVNVKVWMPISVEFKKE